MGKPASRCILHYARGILLSMCVMRSLSAAGITNTGGLFLSPVSTGLGVGVENLSIYFSISSVAAMLTLPFAEKLIGRLGIRAIILFAAALQALSFICLRLMNSGRVWNVMFTPIGVGSAIRQISQIASQSKRRIDPQAIRSLPVFQRP